MVVPAMQLASKIPDMSVQLWSSALLKGIFSLILVKHDLCFMFCYRLTLKMKTLKALQWEYLALVLLSCLQTWTRPLGTTWTPMKQPRCTRTSPSSCCRTTSLPAAYLSITSSVYVKQQVLFHVPYWIYIFPLVHCCVFILCVYVLLFLTVFLFMFFSGLMALLLSRSKPRTAQPPASQACYEKPAVRLAYDCSCSITSNRLMPNNLLSDHCSWDLRWF